MDYHNGWIEETQFSMMASKEVIKDPNLWEIDFTRSPPIKLWLPIVSLGVFIFLFDLCFGWLVST